MATFNVLYRDFNAKCFIPYDVIPYFVSRWKDKRFKYLKKDVKTLNDFKEWVKYTSQVEYWARAQYEILLAAWPFGSYKLREDLKNIEDFNKCLDEEFYKIENVITKEMQKIDIHKQIMMNIDVLTEILAKEVKFKPKKIKEEKDNNI